MFAIIVNRVTGSKASNLEALTLEPSERELWLDAGADFATVFFRDRLSELLTARA